MKKLSTAQVKALRQIDAGGVELNDWGNGLGLINWSTGISRKTGERLLDDGYIYTDRTLIKNKDGTGYWSNKRLQVKLTSKGRKILDAIDSVINCKACDSSSDKDLDWNEVEVAFEIRN